jgi:hypothetical protein
LGQLPFEENQVWFTAPPKARRRLSVTPQSRCLAMVKQPPMPPDFSAADAASMLR